MNHRPTFTTWLAAIVVMAGAWLRLVNLDADPDYYDWVGYVTDEGRWVQAARSLSLYGELPGSRLGSLHLLIAPLFQAGSFATFSLFGVTVLSARLLPALAACGILVVFWMMMRPVAGPQIALLGLSLLAFQPDLLALSRMAIPEVPVMFLALMVYWVLLSSPTSRGVLGAGLLTLLTLAMKMTAAPLVPVASAIVVATAPASTRLRALLLYWSGVFTLPLVAVSAWLAFYAPDLRGVLMYPAQAVSQVLGVADLFSIVSFPFSSGLAWTFNTWALGLWLSLLSVVPRVPLPVDISLRRHRLASAVWIVVFGPIMIGLSYFPPRYQVLLLLPLAIHLVCALSVLSRVGPSAIAATFPGLAGLRGVAWRGVLVFPSAVFAAPVLIHAVTIAGGAPERLTTRLSAVATATALLWLAAQLGKGSSRLVWWFLRLPPIALVVFLAQSMSGMSFWPAEVGAWWTAVGLVIAAGVAMMTEIPGSTVAGGFDSRRLLTGVAVAVAAVALAREAPRYLFPHYTIRAASEDLSSVLSECSGVRILRSEGLFNDNAVRYDSLRYGEVANCLVTTFLSEDEAEVIARDYDQVLKRYEIFVSQRYCESFRSRASSACPVIVEVYRRNPSR